MIASRPGVASSRSESRVQMSTTLPYSGRPVPSMMPGISLNWRRTSETTAPAARPTALIARPENMNTTAAPISRPTSTLGENTWAENVPGSPGAIRGLWRGPGGGRNRVGGRWGGAERGGGPDRGCSDPDAFGDRLGGVPPRVELGEDLRACA